VVQGAPRAHLFDAQLFQALLIQPPLRVLLLARLAQQRALVHGGLLLRVHLHRAVRGHAQQHWRRHKAGGGHPPQTGQGLAPQAAKQPLRARAAAPAAAPPRRRAARLA
jgi:hypothetical protein